MRPDAGRQDGLLQSFRIFGYARADKRHGRREPLYGAVITALPAAAVRPEMIVAATHGLLLPGAREKLNHPAVRQVSCDGHSTGGRKGLAAATSDFHHASDRGRDGNDFWATVRSARCIEEERLAGRARSERET